MIFKIHWQNERDGFLFTTIAELTASGRSRRPSGRSPYSALFVAGSLKHRSFERVIICACIIASTSLLLPNVNHIRTPRATVPHFGSFVRAYFNTSYTSRDKTVYICINRGKNSIRAFF